MAYIGHDFPSTQPGTELAYPFDFSALIAIRPTQQATLGGAVTVGDSIGITFTDVLLPDSPYTINVLAVAGDTLDTIAAEIDAQINGDFGLASAGISSTVAGAVLTISYPVGSVLSFGSSLLPACSCSTSSCAAPVPTETLEFAAGAFAGEVISDATVTCAIYLGGTDDDPSARIIGDATITGGIVTTVAGNFVAGNTYRLTCTIETAEQPSVILYSHVAVALPQ